MTFSDSYTLEVGGERRAWHGPNHSPDKIYIHFPHHDTLMFIDVVNPVTMRGPGISAIVSGRRST